MFHRSPESRRRRRWRQARERARVSWFVHRPISAAAQKPRAPSLRARERVLPAWVLPARAIPRQIAVRLAIAPRTARLRTAPPLAIAPRPFPVRLPIGIDRRSLVFHGEAIAAKRRARLLA